ncbi:platelet endothelial aggregation receptor 1-like [Saccostrea cucullata]|uniref:platelet endothelial aggregation receptor 1-like n=1 Tax=Saccostrea cuccullata TaxID=36930 RepID=UPI002ED14F9A
MEVDIMCHNIMIKITFFVAFCICIFQGSSEEKAVCSEKESPIKCCANYKLRGKDCIPCYGYSGPQCARSCLPGYCGFGCKNECLCEQCFPVNCSCFYDQDVEQAETKRKIKTVN